MQWLNSLLSAKDMVDVLLDQIKDGTLQFDIHSIVSTPRHVANKNTMKQREGKYFPKRVLSIKVQRDVFHFSKNKNKIDVGP